MVEFDLDYQGDSLTQAVSGGNVFFRREGSLVLVGVSLDGTGMAVWVDAEQAEAIGTNLLAAAEASRRAQGTVATAPNPAGGDLGE
jgi:hypothetical protein